MTAVLYNTKRGSGDSGEHLAALLFNWMQPVVVTSEVQCRYGNPGHLTGNILVGAGGGY